MGAVSWLRNFRKANSGLLISDPLFGKQDTIWGNTIENHGYFLFVCMYVILHFDPHIFLYVFTRWLTLPPYSTK